MENKTIISSFGYKFIERIAVKGVGLIVSITLARILEPDTYGLLAIVTVFITLAQSFVQSGLGTALVQNRTTNAADYSTVFFFSLGVAVILGMILFAAAPLIASFYDNEALIWPIRAMLLSLPVGALNSVQNAKFQREMQFKKPMYCNLAATILAGMVGIAAACSGAELWALVIYDLTNIVAVTLFMLLADNLHLHLSFSVQRMKVFWGFGWKMLVSGLLCSLYNDARSLIIAKKYSVTDLGVYNKGQQFPEFIASTIDSVMQSVMLPVMSQEQDALDRLKDMLIVTMGMSMFVITPIMLGLAAVARTFIPLLLTERWNASIPYVVIFCLSSLTLPIMTTNLSAIKAMGRSDIYMKTEVLRRIVMSVILLVAVFAFNSVKAIAISYFVSTVVDIVIITYVVYRVIGITILQQLQRIAKILISGAIMFIIVWLINYTKLTGILLLIIQILVGAAVYLAVSWILKVTPLMHLLSLLRKPGHQ